MKRQWSGSRLRFKLRQDLFLVGVMLMATGIFLKAEAGNDRRVAAQAYQVIAADSLSLHAPEPPGKQPVATLTITALGIRYPVMQGRDNGYFLDHLYNGTPNQYGSIMLNCDNSSAFTDDNTILYGHDARDGSMFGRLKWLKTMKADRLDIVIDTGRMKRNYKVVAVAIVAADNPVFQIRFTDDSWQTALSELKKTALYYQEPRPASERFLTLSTCEQNQRFVVIGQSVR